MSGDQLIKEIVKHLNEAKIPPMDGRIMSVLRGIPDIQEWFKNSRETAKESK